MEIASSSSDAVIVNGGLGPTLDDLTQAAAATAANTELELHQEWLDHIAGWYRSRGRVMPENNRKQALLPQGSELIDNPIGTACGFAMDIFKVRFFFTPGVPREMYTMLDQEIIPRLQKIRGMSLHTHIKRFHSFGIGESRADKMLAKAAAMAAKTEIKLGFQSHYPQLEIKLVANTTVPAYPEFMHRIEDEIRNRLGNFIVSEDSQTLEGNILQRLQESGASIAVVEMHTAGLINSRLLCRVEQHAVVKAGTVSQSMDEICELFALPVPDRIHPAFAKQLANLISQRSASTCGLAVLTEPYCDGNDQQGLGVHLGISGNARAEYRQARLPGTSRWARIGATELGLDFLRRFLAGLPVHEMIDFEQH